MSALFLESFDSHPLVGQFQSYIKDPNVLLFLLVCHAINACIAVRNKLKYERGGWLYHLLSTCLVGVGGGTISCLILGLHPHALESNHIIPLIAIIWYFINHSPNDLLFKLVSFPLLKLVYTNGASVHRAIAIVSGLLRVSRVIPGSHVAALLIGTISGIGGTILLSILSNTPSELSRPTYAIKSAFWAALFLYLEVVPPVASLITVAMVFILVNTTDVIGIGQGSSTTTTKIKTK